MTILELNKIYFQYLTYFLELNEDIDLKKKKFQIQVCVCVCVRFSEGKYTDCVVSK